MMHYSDIEAAELARRWHESVLSATMPYLMSGTATPLLRDLLDVESLTGYSEFVYTRDGSFSACRQSAGKFMLHYWQKVIENQRKPHCDANEYERN